MAERALPRPTKSKGKCSQPGCDNFASVQFGDGLCNAHRSNTAAAGPKLTSEQLHAQNCCCAGQCRYIGDPTMHCCVKRPGPTVDGDKPYPCAACVRGRAAYYRAQQESGVGGITQAMLMGHVAAPDDATWGH